MPDEKGRTRNWCFTSFQKPKAIHWGTHISYIMWQEEICPTSGKHHWQGYLEMKKKQTMKFVKEKVFDDNTIHLEIRFGSQEQAVLYCSKKETAVEGTAYAWGELSRQGDRSDLQGLLDEIENGRSIRQILRSHGGHALRFISHIEKAQRAIHNMSRLDNALECMQELDDCNKGDDTRRADIYMRMAEYKPEY